MDILTDGKLTLFVLFVIPGFISMRVWSILVPTENQKLSDYILEAISYSCINMAIFSWLLLIIFNSSFRKNHVVWSLFFIFLILFVFPILWPIILRSILDLKILSKRILNPIPKAWDYFFNKRISCYMIIHLKNGNRIGGFYGGHSCATSYPNSEDLYIEEVWKLDDDDNFDEAINGTRGMWLDKDSYTYIEFVDAIFEGDSNDAE